MKLGRQAKRLLRRLRGDQDLDTLAASGVPLGRNVVIARPNYIDATFLWLVSIGDDTILAPNVQIVAHDASMKRLTGYMLLKPVSVGSRAYIGAGSIVLPGVTVGTGRWSEQAAS